jgi:branched-chain amino acid transport system substrate-binding protein
MRDASGRFLFLAVSLWLAGCQLAGPSASEPATPAGPLDPVIDVGPISSGRSARAAEIFAEASAAFDSGRFGEARRLAQDVVDRFPSAPVSGRALLLTARAAAAVGDGAAADAAAERYLALLPDADTRRASVRLLQAEAIAADPSARIDRLLRIEPGAPRNDLIQGTALLRQTLESVGVEELAAILERAPGDGPLAPIAQVRLGVLLLERGDEAEAARLAREAIDAGASGVEARLAAGLLRGELPGGRPRTTALRIASVLPLTGSPALSDFSKLVAEGIEVAAAEALGERYEVSVDSRDDEGDPELSASLTRELEGARVAGVVGFLEDASLEAAGLARSGGLPLVSPTARSADRAGRGVYSLEGPNPQAAAAMARYAAEQGFVRVAIVHSQTPESAAEADAFEATMRSLGIPVVGRYAYDVGATFFEDQIMGAQNALRAEEIAALELGEDDTLHVELLEPVALFLPIPPEDVEYVAPQVTHFGLDTLAIRILGTSGWTDPQVLEEVDTRHTTGVVATARVGAEATSPGARRFRAAYERHFQRSLVSPIPAVGYDATLLLLDALRDGGTAPVRLRAAFDRLRDVEGATGVFSVIGGRVVPRTEIVQIDHATLVPIG